MSTLGSPLTASTMSISPCLGHSWPLPEPSIQMAGQEPWWHVIMPMNNVSNIGEKTRSGKRESYYLEVTAINFSRQGGSDLQIAPHLDVRWLSSGPDLTSCHIITMTNGKKQAPGMTPAWRRWSGRHCASPPWWWSLLSPGPELWVIWGDRY